MADKLLGMWARALVALYPPDFRDGVGRDLARLLVDSGRSTARFGQARLLGYLVANSIICIRDAALEWGTSIRTHTGGGGGRTMRAFDLRTLRFAARGLLRRPGYTVPALLTLALGIGATTAMFSVLYGVVLKPLPYPDPDRIVQVFAAHEENPFAWFSAPDARDWAERTRTLEALGTYTVLPGDVILTGDGDAVELETAYVTPGFFEALGVVPELGRYLTREDDETDNRVVVLSHALWSERFGGDPDLVGRVLTIEEEGYRVVGVMPAEFDFPNRDVEVWVLLSTIPPSDAPWPERWMRILQGVGRLAPGVDMEGARAELSSIALALSEEYPETNERTTSANLRPLHQGLVGDVSTALTILMGAAGLVLLLVCANVANLALARETQRGPDLAVRAALGASRAHRVGLVVAESLLLAVLGAGLGLALATWGTALLVGRSAGAIPRAHAIGPDWRVAAFALGISVATGLVFAILPGIKAGREGLAQRLAAAGRGGGAPRMRAALVVSQMALSVVLLVGATLLVRSLWSLGRMDPGFAVDELLVAHITFPGTRYQEREAYLRRYDETLQAFEEIPGVTAAGAIRWFPFLGQGEGFRWNVPGASVEGDEGTDARSLQVSSGLFEAMGVEFVEGTGFAPDAGRDGRPVVIVSETLARQAYGSGPAAGRQLLLESGATVEIVGVVEDVHQVALDAAPMGTVYLPQYLSPRRGASFVLRTEGDPASLIPAVRAVVRSHDPAQPITHLATATDIVGRQMARPGFYTLLLAAFAGLAVILSTIGVYGVVAAGVARRRREVGIRMAMGADAATVRALVVREGMAPVLAGLGLGLAGALAGSRVLESLLYGVGALDPATYALAALTLALVGAAACYVPARSASGTDPVAALTPE